MIDGAEVHTAGWMPGYYWPGTPWEPIYTHATTTLWRRATASGLFVWVMLPEYPRHGNSGGTRRTASK